MLVIRLELSAFSPPQLITNQLSIILSLSINQQGQHSWTNIKIKVGNIKSKKLINLS